MESNNEMVLSAEDLPHILCPDLENLICEYINPPPKLPYLYDIKLNYIENRSDYIYSIEQQLKIIDRPIWECALCRNYYTLVCIENNELHDEEIIFSFIHMTYEQVVNHAFSDIHAMCINEYNKTQIEEYDEDDREYLYQI